jgi:Caspase domain
MRGGAFRDLVLVVAFLLSSQISLPRAALAESRVALVIGQSAYRAVPALPNAANDGRHMAELLGSAGFDVTAAPDLAQNEMRQAISDFAAKVAAKGPDTVALVFYAGHGLQIDGENYLVPVDIDPKREADIPLQAVRLNDLMNTLGVLPTRMRIFMLDACRNNPFPALSQTAGRGLAIVNTRAGAPGSFISFSTSPGAEAEDGSGEDSPYTTAVLTVAKEPNLSIEEAFKRVRVAVNEATDGRQVPWESSSLTSDFRFFGDAASGATPSGQAAAPKPATVTRSADDWRRDLGGKEPKAAYELVIADNSVAAFEAFGALYGESSYAPRVRSLLERRKEMLAWEVAVATNTAASYEAFLAAYASSDLAATARKLQVRVINRTLLVPTNVALGPTCPCPTTPVPPLLKKVEPTPQPPTKRADRRKKGGDNEPVVVDRGPPGPPPGAILEGIGIGAAIGLGLGGGMRGGGMRGGTPATNSPRMYDR